MFITALFTIMKDMKTTQMSINKWMGKKDAVHIHNGMLFSHKKGRYPVTTWVNLEHIIPRELENKHKLQLPERSLRAGLEIWLKRKKKLLLFPGWRNWEIETLRWPWATDFCSCLVTTGWEATSSVALSEERGTPASHRSHFPLPDLTLMHLLSEIPGTAVFSF